MDPASAAQISRTVHELETIVNPGLRDVQVASELTALRSEMGRIDEKVDSLATVLKQVLGQARVTLLQVTIANELAIAAGPHQPGLGFLCPFAPVGSGRVIPIAPILQCFLGEEEADVDNFLEFSCYPVFLSSSESEQMRARLQLTTYLARVMGGSPPLLVQKAGSGRWVLVEGGQRNSVPMAVSADSQDVL